MFLLRLLSGNWRWALAGLALAVVSMLANIALMAVSGSFLTGMAIAGAAGASFNYFVPAATIRALAILRSGSRYLERLATHEATFRLIGGMRARVFRALAPRLPFGLPGVHSGDLSARLGGDLDSLQRAYLQLLVPAAAAGLVGTAVVAYGWGVNRTAAAVLAVGLLLGGAGLPALLARAGRVPGRTAVEALSDLRAWAVDMADGREELDAFAATRRHAGRLEGMQHRLATAQRRTARQEAFAASGTQALGSLLMWAVVLAGAPTVAAGAVAATDLVMLAFLALASTEAIAPLAGAFQAWGAVAASCDRVRPLLSPATAASQPADKPAAATPVNRTPPLVRLIDVTARYPGATTPALRNLTLDLPPGARIALIGPSGSGKSTVLALLAGFLGVETGRIEIAGRDGCATSLLTTAPQTPHLLAGSLSRNLLVADPDASDAAMLGACATAGLGSWLAGLPDGLDTVIGAGGRPLSGGEARRLTVARALLGSGPLLVLDEPGEGLDPATERAMMDRLLEAAGGRTVLLITHRATGLEHMDHVAVLDRGQLLDQGAPWTLAGRDGPFRRFLERSFV
ncbi:hypothetical protein TSO352_15535 [Azospirillum sp. TSO35-2]|nr:hypothetical protein TSO352_15535 [Azospirillum sp. TSO35-2]